MSKVITGGTASSGGYTDTYSNLTATIFTNTNNMTSPQSTIINLDASNAAIGSANITYTLNVPTLNSTSGNVTSLSVGTITNKTSMTSPSIIVTDLSSSAATTTNLTVYNSITTYDCNVTGTLSFSGTLDQTNLSTQTLVIGTETVSFPTGVSEFDTTSITYDIDNKFTEFIDKRTNFGTVQNGADLSISVDDPDTPEVETSYGINGVAAIEFGGAMTSYIDADTSSTASSNDMTVVIVFRKADECDTIISYEAAQPSFNCTGGVLYLERAGKYNLNTGITITDLTPYILVATLSATAGLKIRINGVQQFSDLTSYGSYHFNSALCDFGRHYTDTSKWFIGPIGNVMTAPTILTATEIDNIETYLSNKFQIAIGEGTPTIRTSDPFSTGSGSCTVYGTIDSVGIVSDTLEVSGATSLNSLTLDGSLTIAGNTIAQELTTSVLTTNGVYYENISSVIDTSTNVYLLSYTNSGIFYIGGAKNPTANFSVSIEQIPTDTTKVYTISLVYYQYTHAYYCNAVRASDKNGNYLLGTASTYAAPKFSGGTPSFSTTPNLVIQQYIVSFPDDQSTMTRYVISSVSPFS
jgi:hypothetical protein